MIRTSDQFTKKYNKQYKWLVAVSCILMNNYCFAQATTKEVTRVGDIFKNISVTFVPYLSLLFSIATIAGLIFTFIAVFKFKQFKDNPQQISIGQPIGLFFLGGIMLWLPYIIQTIGGTLTGQTDVNQIRHGQSVTNPTPDSGFGQDLKSIQ